MLGKRTDVRRSHMLLGRFNCSSPDILTAMRWAVTAMVSPECAREWPTLASKPHHINVNGGGETCMQTVSCRRSLQSLGGVNVCSGDIHLVDPLRPRCTVECHMEWPQPNFKIVRGSWCAYGKPKISGITRGRFFGPTRGRMHGSQQRLRVT